MKDRVLTAYMKDFVQQFGLTDLDEADAFEHFVTYCVISKYQSDTFEIEDAVVGGRGDIGVDGIGILVNDHLVYSTESVDFFKKSLRRLDVQFIFVQAKTAARFEADDIGTFVSGVRQFFETSPPSLANDTILAMHQLKEYIFDSSIDMDQSPTCKLYYVTTGTWLDDSVLGKRIDQGTADLRATNLFSSVEFIPLGSEELKLIHRELHRKITREIVFDKHAILPQIDGVQEAYIGIVPCSEYLKLICDDEGNLNRRLFYDNVRDFQGHNAVNREIEATVHDAAQSDRFALLNNGVTVVARNINKVGATFRLQDYQIVNGCQTSHILYLNQSHLTPNVYLPLKLIVTDDAEVTNQIIQGTNRQTEVKLEAFESLAPFQKKLEEFYLSVGREREDPVYYERRSKQYEHLSLRRDRVITLATQIQSFVAMFLNEPHSTHRYYGELLNSYRSRLFSDSHSQVTYFISGLALANVECLFAGGRLPRIWKRDKYQLLMVFRIQNQPFKLPYLNSRKVDSYCQTLLSLLHGDSSTETAFQRAGDLVASVRASITSRDPPERTRAFTNELISAASQLKEERTATTVRTRGTVKWYSDIRNYGFITGDDGKDYFVHYTGLVRSGYRPLVAGQPVEFGTVNTPRGIQAIDVEAVDS